MMPRVTETQNRNTDQVSALHTASILEFRVWTHRSHWYRLLEAFQHQCRADRVLWGDKRHMVSPKPESGTALQFIHRFFCTPGLQYNQKSCWLFHNIWFNAPNTKTVVSESAKHTQKFGVAAISIPTDNYSKYSSTTQLSWLSVLAPTRSAVCAAAAAAGKDCHLSFQKFWCHWGSSVGFSATRETTWHPVTNKDQMKGLKRGCKSMKKGQISDLSSVNISAGLIEL